MTQLLHHIIYVISWILLLYSLLLLLSYFILSILSVWELRIFKKHNQQVDWRMLAKSPHMPSLSIIAPAYNEAATIVDNARSLLNMHYPNLEVVIVNDGSKDNSLQLMLDAYDMEKLPWYIEPSLSTQPIEGVYKSRNPVYRKLLLVDKKNGGKADALNAGINMASGQLLTCIDVDCVLEQDALLRMVKPFLDNDEKEIIASGGTIRIANGCVISDGVLEEVRPPSKYLPLMQTVEYFRAFMMGRMAWARLNGLLLISGAFGIFSRKIVLDAGGYDHSTVGEDMELVVRMRRIMEEQHKPYAVTFSPDPLCWTEAPESLKILGRQRNRWTRGTIETLHRHQIMLLNPSYGLLGLFSYPYWLLFEMMAPLIEIFGMLFLVVLAVFNLVGWSMFFKLLALIVLGGYLFSFFSILMETWYNHQYRNWRQLLKLFAVALTEPVIFHPFVVWSGLKGFWDKMRKKNSWGEMTRVGFARKPNTATVTLAALKSDSIKTGPELRAQPAPLPTKTA